MQNKEQGLSSERLEEMVKGGMVTHYGNVFQVKGKSMNEKKMVQLTSISSRVGGALDPGLPIQVSFIPLTSVRSVEDPNNPFPWSNKDIGVVFKYTAERADVSRSPRLGGVGIMSGEDSEIFKDELIKDPRILFLLVKALNPEPYIRQHDGNPANIVLSERIVILPNKSLGGDIMKPIKTAPFPANFKPNTLY